MQKDTKNRWHIPEIFIEAYREWIRDRANNLAASLAYYQFLSLTPFIGFCLFLSNKILGTERANEDVIPILQNYFSPQFVKVVVFFMNKDEYSSVEELYALSIISGLALAYATKEYFGMVKDAIEISWKQLREKSGMVEALKRLKDDLLVAFAALFILFSFLLLRSILPHPFITSETALQYQANILIHLVGDFFEFVMSTALLGFYFTVIPPVKVYWKNAVFPAMLGSVYLVIGREVMRWHMYQHPSANLSESFLVVLIWFYYSNLAFVYAVEFAKLYIARKQNIDLSKLSYYE